MLEVVIFDPGAALVQLDAVDAQAYAQAALALRPSLAADTIAAYALQHAGLSRHQRSSELVRQFGLEAAARARMAELTVATPWQSLLQLRARAFDELIGSPTMLDRARLSYHDALLYTARAMGCRIALATTLACRQVRQLLVATGLADTFDLVAAREDVEHGWPDPEIYRLVAHELQVPPRDCLAVDSSLAGARAALAAGMSVLAVAPPSSQALFAALAPVERYSVAEPGAGLPGALYACIARHQRAALHE